MSIKTKLLLIAGLVLTLAALAAIQSASWTTAARIILGAAGLIGGAYWYAKRAQPAAFTMETRVNVVQRVGLSQRNALALVEVDGQSYLIVHGDGFARIERTAPNSAPHLVKDSLTLSRNERLTADRSKTGSVKTDIVTAISSGDF
jgi:flagellar biogenesis protein FliO